MSSIESIGRQRVPGTVGRTVEESSPAWPAPARARDGAPNVLFFVLDDVGYGQLSSFGGLVETPNIDRLAAQGLRYANMHTTALCSPTRSCVLTGRNHHSSAWLRDEMETDTQACLAHAIRDGSCRRSAGARRQPFCVGKWQLPLWGKQAVAVHRWPLGRVRAVLGSWRREYRVSELTQTTLRSRSASAGGRRPHQRDLTQRDSRPDAPRQRARKPFFCNTGRGGHARSCAGGVGGPLQGQVRRGMDSYARRVSRAEEIGCSLRTRSCNRAKTGADGTR